MSRRQADQRGATMISFALILPVIALLVLGSLELWRWIATRADLRDASRLLAISTQHECPWSGNQQLCLDEQVQLVLPVAQTALPNIELSLSHYQWSAANNRCERTALSQSGGAMSQLVIDTELSQLCQQHQGLYFAEAATPYSSVIPFMTSILRPGARTFYAISVI